MFGFIKEHKRKRLLEQLKKGDSNGKSAQRAVLNNFERITSIGFCFLLNGSADVDQYTEIKDFFSKQGIPFKGIIVEEKKSFAGSAEREGFRNRVEEDNLLFIGKDDLDWTGVPKTGNLMGRIGELLQQHFSLFMFLGPIASFTAEYLALQVDADCIAGMENSSKLPLSFVLEPQKGNFSYAGYLASFFLYLKDINVGQSVILE